MSDRSNKAKRMIRDAAARRSYTRASVCVNVASQIRNLRINRGMTQKQLAEAADMKQSRIAVIETPGAPVSVETLVRLAAAFEVGLQIKFVSFSEMERWENDYQPATFNVKKISDDIDFMKDAIMWADVIQAPGKLDAEGEYKGSAIDEPAAASYN